MGIRNFFQKGLFVYCRAIIKPRPWGDNPELELKILDIALLEDIFDNRTKSIRLNIPLENITDELCEELQNIAKKCKGKVPLYATVFSNKLDVWLDMRSMTMLVKPSKFVKAIEKMPQIISFDVNTKNKT